MVDLTDAEFAGQPTDMEFHEVVLKKLGEEEAETIYNTIILEKDKDAISS